MRRDRKVMETVKREFIAEYYVWMDGVSNTAEERYHTVYALSKTYDCRTPSIVVEQISFPEGISLMMETRFAKHSPALYASIPGAAISSISASKKCSLTKRTVE